MVLSYLFFASINYSYSFIFKSNYIIIYWFTLLNFSLTKLRWRIIRRIILHCEKQTNLRRYIFSIVAYKFTCAHRPYSKSYSCTQRNRQRFIVSDIKWNVIDQCYQKMCNLRITKYYIECIKKRTWDRGVLVLVLH